MNQQELWKDIKGFEGKYQVSNLGNVKSLKRKEIKILLPLISKKGYCCVCLYKKCKFKHAMIHRLVANAFIPNPENKPQINHIDGNKKNNHIKNLEWCTNSENQKHSYQVLGNVRSDELRKKISQTLKGKFINEMGANSKKVLCKETNIIYCSQVEAERKTGISRKCISLCCCRKTKTAGGYHWEYAQTINTISSVADTHTSVTKSL